MGNLLACCCAAQCLTSCVGTICGCGSGNGNDDELSTSSSAFAHVSSGRKWAVFLLSMSVFLSLLFQYEIGPALSDSDSFAVDWVTDMWTGGGCGYEDADHAEACRGNAGVYRVCMVTTLFFLILGTRANSKTSRFGKRWFCKCLWYLAGVFGTIFVPNEVFNDTGYLQVARIGGCLFIFLQQIILIDMAYEWNDNWVAKADACEREEYGSGRKWLVRIILACIVLYTIAFVSLGFMFDEFSGCASNETFMSLTVIGIVIITVLQLSGEEGSLLTSACIALYAVWLCFMAVSKNPTESCNPLYGDESVLAVSLSCLFTVLSMAWMGWSLTVDDRLTQIEEGSVGAMTKNHSSRTGSTGMEEIDEPLIEDEENNDGVDGENGDGVVLEEDMKKSQGGIVTDDGSASLASWEVYYGGMARKICLAMALLSTWTAVSLTSWGQIGSDGDAANPEVGEVSMWMIITSQWIVMLLYSWSMLAPKLFPDRDFS